MYKRLFLLFAFLLFTDKVMASRLYNCSAVVSVEHVAQKSFQDSVYTLSVAIEDGQESCFGAKTLVFDVGAKDTEIEWRNGLVGSGLTIKRLHVHTNDSLWVQTNSLNSRAILGISQGMKLHLDLQHADGFCIYNIAGKAKTAVCDDDRLTLSALDEQQGRN